MSAVEMCIISWAADGELENWAKERQENEKANYYPFKRAIDYALLIDAGPRPETLVVNFWFRGFARRATQMMVEKG